jgi:purine-binding chemotaxis protein CheW
MAESTILEDRAAPEETSGPDSRRHAEGTIQVLGFHLAGSIYGLDTDAVIEIVQQVEVTELPEAPEYVEGLINIRETVVPLVNMQKLLKVGDKKHDTNTQIIVVFGENGIVGLLVDYVSDIVTVPRRRIMKPSKSTTPITDFVSGVVDAHDFMTLLLDVNKLVDHKRWGPVVERKIGAGVALGIDSAAVANERRILRQRATELRKKNKEESSTKRRFVTFLLGEEWYGIDIAYVREISRAADVYFIPSAPAHICGAINLRGGIVPVVDLKKFLGLSQASESSDISIIVVERDNVTMGLLADLVGDIIDIADASVEPPLATIQSDKVDCIEGGVEWEGKLMGILNLGRILQA